MQLCGHLSGQTNEGHVVTTKLSKVLKMQTCLGRIDYVMVSHISTCRSDATNTPDALNTSRIVVEGMLFLGMFFVQCVLPEGLAKESPKF